MSNEEAIELSYLTAMVITPPPELWERIQVIRRELEPSHVDIWPPHITLVYPFLPIPEFEARRGDVEAAASSIAPFEVVLDTFGTFNQGRRGKLTYLKPDNASTRSIRSLRSQLVDESLADCISSRFRQPHMTVGRWADEPQDEILQEGWEPLSFTVDSIAILERPEKGLPLATVATIPLSPQ